MNACTRSRSSNPLSSTTQRSDIKRFSVLWIDLGVAVGGRFQPPRRVHFDHVLPRTQQRGRPVVASTVRSLRRVSGSPSKLTSTRKSDAALRRPALALANRRSLRPRGDWAGHRTGSPTSSRRRPPGSSASASERSRTASPGIQRSEVEDLAGIDDFLQQAATLARPADRLQRFPGGSASRYSPPRIGGPRRRAPREPLHPKPAGAPLRQRLLEWRRPQRRSGSQRRARTRDPAAGGARLGEAELQQAMPIAFAERCYKPLRCALIERSVGLNHFEAQARRGASAR